MDKKRFGRAVMWAIPMSFIVVSMTGLTLCAMGVIESRTPRWVPAVLVVFGFAALIAILVSSERKGK